MNKASERRHDEFKRPPRTGRQHGVKRAVAPKANAQIALLKRRLLAAQLQGAPEYVIKLLNRQIELLRLSKGPRPLIGKAMYPGKYARLSRSMKRRRFFKRPATGASSMEVISLTDTRAHQHFVPQAIVSEPVKTFADRTAARVVEDSDALDHFVGVAFAMEGMPFTIMNYRGHPPETSTIYLPQEISSVDEITARIAKILGRFGLPPSALVWQRRDDPDL